MMLFNAYLYPIPRFPRRCTLETASGLLVLPNPGSHLISDPNGDHPLEMNDVGDGGAIAQPVIGMGCYMRG